MVIKYVNINTLEKLFKDKNNYFYWLNIYKNKFKVEIEILKKNKSKININFFRFFFWFFYTNFKINNFIIFFKYFKAIFMLCKLILYLKFKKINFFNLINYNSLFLYKKIDYVLLNKNIEIIFLFTNKKINLKQNKKICIIDLIAFEFLKIFLYFI